MKNKRTVFDTSSEVTKKKDVPDINAEPEMVELKRMIRDGELDAGRTIADIKGELNHEDAEVAQKRGSRSWHPGGQGREAKSA